MSKYKNELGTLNSERLLEIHNFATSEHKKGNYELYQLVSDFAEQQCEGKEKEIAELKLLGNDCVKTINEQTKRISELEAEKERLKGLIIELWEAQYPPENLKYVQDEWQKFKTENNI
jgi:hypothetical protein